MPYNEALIHQLKDICIQRKLTLAVAESVTAGHVQAALSLATDASLFFHGGITAYNLGQKTRHLNVNPIVAQEVNCVSEPIADTMALNVCKLFTAHIGLAITGYATPTPATEKCGLFAHISIADEGTIVVSEMLKADEMQPMEVQIQYTNLLLGHLHDYLTRR